jgi:hypothetical protein
MLFLFAPAEWQKWLPIGYTYRRARQCGRAIRHIIRHVSAHVIGHEAGIRDRNRRGAFLLFEEKK